MFWDRNGNGRHDLGEAGLPQVGVSNGRDVVRTDWRGNYRLSVVGDQIVFVIQPAGYKLPTDAIQRPLFYHLHGPDGSRSDAEAGGAPPGLPAAYDFPLLTDDTGERFSMLVFADPQVRTSEQLRYVEETVVADLRGTDRYRLVITLGDLVHDRPELLEPLAAIIGQIGVPWFSVLGNHDIDRDAPDQNGFHASFSRAFGPAHYAFNVGKVHFVVLNSIRFLGQGQDGPRFRGGLLPDQLEFLKNDLEGVPKDRLVVVAMHYPIFKTERPPFRREDRLALLALLADYPHTLSLSGHTHVQGQWFLGPQDGWHGTGEHHHYNVGTVSGSWWRGPRDRRGIPIAPMRDGGPKGYATVDFDGVDYRLDYQGAGLPASYRMAVYLRPGREGSHDQLIVNYFMRSQRTMVEYRLLPDTQWRPMTRTSGADPAYEESWRRMTSDGRKPGGWNKLPEPLFSIPVWRAVLTPRSEATRVEVRVHDNGRQFLEAVTVRPNGDIDRLLQLNAPGVAAARRMPPNRVRFSGAARLRWHREEVPRECRVPSLQAG